MLQLILFVSLICSVARAGTLWPLPQNRTFNSDVLYLHPRFKFVSQGHDSDILNDAFDRYECLYFNPDIPSTLSEGAIDGRLGALSGAIERVEVYVTLNDQSLGLHTSEVYTLRVAAPTTYIQATTVYGALRAMETMAQLLDAVPVVDRTLAALPADVAAALQQHDAEQEEDVMLMDVGRHHHKKHQRKKHKPKTLFILNKTSIYDSPRFKHRGLLIDTGRHWLPVHIIKAHLDAMEMSKLNVLHWHLVDDQSFPYQSDRLPDLSDKGAFIPGKTIYTSSDIEDILYYARARGIRVVPEFDTPGHVASWGRAYPDLLTVCYDSHKEPMGQLGPLDVSKEKTYTLLWQLLKEAATLFGDSFVHIGGDEVDESCWKSNAYIKQWMNDQGMKKDASLQRYHTTKVLDLIAAAGKRAIVWQEVMDIVGKDALSKDVVVQVWKWPSGNKATNMEDEASNSNISSRKLQSTTQVITSMRPNSSAMPQQKQEPQQQLEAEFWPDELKTVTATHRAILSAPWYLDMAVSASDWEKLWSVDPIPFKAGIDQVERVLGGEACMWGEMVDWTNAISKAWPNAAAVAERLWSDVSERDVEKARLRMAEHRCRMVARGVLAAPIGPGWCGADPL